MNLREKHQITAEQGQSLDVKTDILQQLQAVAPSVFADGKIDVERLKQLIGESAIAQGERYALSWAGKSETLEVLRQPVTGTLVPAPEESVNFDQTGHVFIEGENLEVLKILQKNYYGQVKMIYIDPPYNTGNDSFIYPDRFEESRADYLRRVNDIDDKDGTLTKAGLYRKNSKENGQYHSNWLNMMYPRLFLARNLLKDDGVIFVSIDDNEVANLRLLMDEVFGEENFVGEIIWKGKGGGADSKFLMKTYENILFYSKSKESFAIGEQIKENEVFPKLDSKKNRKYKTQLARKWGANSKRSDRPNLFYSIIAPDNREVFPILPDGTEGCWRWSKAKMLEEIENENIEFVFSDDSWVVYEKIYEPLEGEFNTKKFSDLLDDVGTTASGTKELLELFKDKCFNFPKPTSLLKRLIDISSAKNEDIILDFFAGSGTTAQAVLELNAEDGGNRKFVCVQLPILNGDAENAKTAGFDHIADIAKERIRRVIKKLETEQNAALGFDKKPDLGMRVFKISPSNFKIWRGDLMENEDELAEQMLLFIDSLKDGAKEDNIAWELAIKSLDPMQLDVRMAKIELGGVPVYNFENGRLFIVLHDISQESINAILAAKPRALLVLDSLFGNQADMITNLVLDCERLNIQFQLV